MVVLYHNKTISPLWYIFHMYGEWPPFVRVHGYLKTLRLPVHAPQVIYKTGVQMWNHWLFDLHLLSGAVCVCALKECVVQHVSVTFVVAHVSVGSLPGLLLGFFFKKLTHPMGLCCGWFLLAKWARRPLWPARRALAVSHSLVSFTLWQSLHLP